MIESKVLKKFLQSKYWRLTRLASLQRIFKERGKYRLKKASKTSNRRYQTSTLLFWMARGALRCRLGLVGRSVLKIKNAMSKSYLYNSYKKRNFFVISFDSVFFLPTVSAKQVQSTKLVPWIAASPSLHSATTNL